ncbi:DUF1294 domain-containing protein [Marinisporobacter balticus]|uniref:Uncharacterized membrane protein YsdA (DUF1294 family) n=1 Tax=Marinisporobacter balticus TaxID=2018667 RepID=A0A4R2L1H5_9FIRM|nr:DUF1294 domain-containing protein [Marinisporobacter balticus]TCO79452.1 uncharacterized membrane protein YsdA (DUF1294 family) [Marinisporobacter balticus]
MKIYIISDTIFKMKEFYFLLYVLIINLYGFCLTGIDKYKAKKEKWRIQEKTFFITACVGGAAGVMMGMSVFRHKTQHKTFYIGIPIFYMINIGVTCILAYWIWFK